MILFPLFIMAVAFVFAGMSTLQWDNEKDPREKQTWFRCANLCLLIGAVATGFAAWMGWS